MCCAYPAPCLSVNLLAVQLSSAPQDNIQQLLEGQTKEQTKLRTLIIEVKAAKRPGESEEQACKRVLEKIDEERGASATSIPASLEADELGAEAAGAPSTKARKKGEERRNALEREAAALQSKGSRAYEARTGSSRGAPTPLFLEYDAKPPLVVLSAAALARAG